MLTKLLLLVFLVLSFSNVKPPLGYQNHEQFLARMKTLELRYPHLFKLLEITQQFGRKTFKGNPIHALKMSLNPELDNNLPNVLIVATHHSREIINPELVMRVAEDLIENFEKDPLKTKYVKEHQIYFLPILNVDGYKHVFEVDIDWRKNLYQGYGVDINRNYPMGFDSRCGGSTNQSDWEYRGTHALSEAESFTLTEFSLDRKFSKVLDVHSRGRVVFCGYSRCLDRNLGIHNYIKDRGTDLARFANYAAPRDALAAGKHEQWHYQKTTFYAFLVETYEGPNWYPPFNIALQEIERVKPLVWRFLDHPIPLSGQVVNEIDHPLHASIEYKELNFNNNETRFTNTKYGRFYEFLPDGKYTIVFRAQGYCDNVHENIVINQQRNNFLIVKMNKCIRLPN